MDLDLNQEPVYSSNDSLLGLASIRDELENTHGHIEERIRQIEAVTFRARQRQRWRQNHFTPQTVNVSVEPATANVRSGGLLIGEASVATEERRDEMNKLGKRKNTYLIAKALGRNGKGKKARGDRRSVFDCNICLDMAQDPILTCCGHLFCWPCFYQLSYVYSNVKECPVCVEEVTDKSIIPIYGNGNRNDNEKFKLKESGLKVPPRPSAQRVESVRQQLVNHGVFSSSIEERMRHFGNVLNAMEEMPPSEGLDGVHLESDRMTSYLANRTSTSQALPSMGADGSQHHHSVQLSRLLFQGAASLSSFSSAVNSAMESAMESTERLFEDLGAFLHSHRGRRNHQQSSRPADRDSFSRIAAAIQPDNQNPDAVADADSTLPHSASSSRPDDVVTVSLLESHRAGTVLENNFSLPVSSSSRRRNLVFRLSEMDNSIETNSSSSRRRIEVLRASDADNGHNRERERRRRRLN